MAIKSITGVSLVLRYKSGSYTYSSVKAEAGDAALYELGGALNSLQAEPYTFVSKIVTCHITGA